MIFPLAFAVPSVVCESSIIITQSSFFDVPACIPITSVPYSRVTFSLKEPQGNLPGFIANTNLHPHKACANFLG